MLLPDIRKAAPGIEAYFVPPAEPDEDPATLVARAAGMQRPQLHLPRMDASVAPEPKFNARQAVITAALGGLGALATIAAPDTAVGAIGQGIASGAEEANLNLVSTFLQERDRAREISRRIAEFNADQEALEARARFDAGVDEFEDVRDRGRELSDEARRREFETQKDERNFEQQKEIARMNQEAIERRQQELQDRIDQRARETQAAITARNEPSRSRGEEEDDDLQERLDKVSREIAISQKAQGERTPDEILPEDEKLVRLRAEARVLREEQLRKRGYSQAPTVEDLQAAAAALSQGAITPEEYTEIVEAYAVLRDL